MTALPPLHAPTANGALLSAPPLAEAGVLLSDNRDRLYRLNAHLLGRPLKDLRTQARQDLLNEVAEYLPGAPVADPAQPYLLAGHQPDLFHPGVWVKNFALAGLAHRHKAVAINVLIDNDTVKSPALLFPVKGNSWPSAHLLAYDHQQVEVPWEERRVVDPAVFARFGDEGSALLRPWGYEPILASFWSIVRRNLSGCNERIGESFASARRALERAWGCENLEVPLSRLCRTESFAWLAGAMLADLPRFVEDYNAIVRTHRARKRIRSRHHPVPDLVVDGDWLEAPLWGWRSEHPRRGRLFVRLQKDRMDLRVGEVVWPSVPSPQRAPERFVEAWRGLEAAGYKVRSRALITTLFARVFLADLFVHGIGGGKYDELTDEILERFCGVQPPGFMILTATCLLPVPTDPSATDRHRRLQHHLRDLHYNPQRHLPSSDLVRAKQAWITQRPTNRLERRERFRNIRHLGEEMRAALADQIEVGKVRLAQLEQHLQANALLGRRDYAFCLHPEAGLRPFLQNVQRSLSNGQNIIGSLYLD